jgi:hypothetical protein
MTEFPGDTELLCWFDFILLTPLSSIPSMYCDLIALKIFPAGFDSKMATRGRKQKAYFLK